jgi:hypothetical protein
MSDRLASPPGRGRLRRRVLLTAVLAAVLAYYVGATASLGSGGPGDVGLSGTGAQPDDRVVIQVEVHEVDPATGSFVAHLRPVPRGAFEAGRSGQLRSPLHVEVASPDDAAGVYDFPSEQAIDPVTMAVSTTGAATAFPFDRPGATFQVEATDDTGPVPVEIELLDEVAGWRLAGDVTTTDAGVRVDVDTRREMLTISFALFYMAGTVVVTLIAVAVVVGALNRRQVDFERVIWLGAMLVVIPAVRNEMPGVPPMGTAADLFVFLPSVVVVALALLATIGRLMLDEMPDRAAAESGG